MVSLECCRNQAAELVQGEHRGQGQAEREAPPRHPGEANPRPIAGNQLGQCPALLGPPESLGSAPARQLLYLAHPLLVGLLQALPQSHLLGCRHVRGCTWLTW